MTLIMTGVHKGELVSGTIYCAHWLSIMGTLHGNESLLQLLVAAMKKCNLAKIVYQ